MAHDTADILRRAQAARIVVPAFNVPYLPMMEAVVRALREAGTFGLITVARLEWVKFQARSLQAIRDEYERVGDRRCTRLHLDHVPVIDEDAKRVDYRGILAEAIRAGYDSIMLDGSRLSLQENIRATREVVEMGHAAGIPVEAELGAVLGHESGPLPPYEELLASGRGFTDPGEARDFVQATGVDWLSVAIGNIHGAISESLRNRPKVEARLAIPVLVRIRDAVGIPLVLHGGTGVRTESLREGIRHGIAKINIGTGIRQVYEQQAGRSIEAGQQAVYEEVRRLAREEFAIEGSCRVLLPPGVKDS